MLYVICGGLPDCTVYLIDSLISGVSQLTHLSKDVSKYVLSFPSFERLITNYGMLVNLFLTHFRISRSPMKRRSILRFVTSNLQYEGLVLLIMQAGLENRMQYICFWSSEAFHHDFHWTRRRPFEGTVGSMYFPPFPFENGNSMSSNQKPFLTQ